jgi:hypothetical protein
MLRAMVCHWELEMRSYPGPREAHLAIAAVPLIWIKGVPVLIDVASDETFFISYFATQKSFETSALAGTFM